MKCGRAVATLARVPRLLQSERQDGRIVPGQDQSNARQRFGARRIDSADARMGMR
jgi:hypothetical protein